MWRRTYYVFAVYGVMLESLLVVLACMLLVMLELLVVLAILAPEAIVRALRRPGPRRRVRHG